MRHAETVTFGGSGLDRATHLRGDAARLQKARIAPQTRAVVLWRGKVLLQTQRETRLERLPFAHPALSKGAVSEFLLGTEQGNAIFAVSLDDWDGDGQDLSTLGAFQDPSEQRHPDFPEGTAFVELRRAMTWLSSRDAELAATARALKLWHDTHGFCARCGAPSEIVQAGWQRTCPSCGAHHFPRTDPVVIMLITHGNSVLMGRSPGWPEGMYSLLAGFMEPGETMEAAVRREVVEESGIQVGDVEYLASQPWPFPASLMLGCKGTALTTEITIDPNEIADARWITREEMMQIFAGAHSDIKPARKGAIAHFLLENWLSDRLD